MPRGVPKAGIRKTRAYIERAAFGNSVMEEPEIFDIETDEEIDQRIRERFEVLEELTNATISGDSRALIASGPAGLGKSFTVEKAVSQLDESQYTIVKGFVRATGLYRILYEMRNTNSVVVFDDSDSIFHDDATLNLLKAACDTTEVRRISWRAETNMRDENEDLIPTSFEFHGSVIFITNYDFDKLISSGHKLSDHLQAMVSRAHYIDLAMKSKRDYIVRIKQVVRDGMLRNMLTPEQINDVIDYIETNQNRLRELSLRMAIKIAGVVRTNPKQWERICNVTCCKM